MEKQKFERPYLNAVEASAYLGIALKTLYKFTSEGELEHYKRGKLFFTKEQLDQFMVSSKRGGVVQ